MLLFLAEQPVVVLTEAQLVLAGAIDMSQQTRRGNAFCTTDSHSLLGLFGMKRSGGACAIDWRIQYFTTPAPPD